MAYIGNTVQNQGFSPAVDYFNGNGVTVTFTLSRPVASVAQMIVAVDNVIQNPSSAFSVVGNSITFTSAPLSGTNNIWVEYTSLITTYQGISQDPTVIGDIRATGGYLAEGDFGNSFIDGNLIDYVTGRGRFTVGELDNITFYHGGTSARSEMMDLYYAGGAKIYGTTALTIPVGTTGQRPTGASGMIRMNSTTGYPEWYDTVTSSWIKFSSEPYTINYLVIAGGGGGGSNQIAYNGGGGGGGAGGYRTSVGTSGGGGSAESPITAAPGTTYTITVGAGGAGGANQAVAYGTSGSNSVFGSITSVGGGGGARSSGSANNGISGGSGGGAGGDTGSGGSGTANQGYAGGSRIGNFNTYGGCGGGGAGAVGVINDAGGGSPGGAGVSSSITGSAVTRAGGGGGGAYNVSAGGAGGSGGGGAGGGNGTGGTGGSGIVILSIPTANYTGTTTGSPTVTTSGSNTILTYNSSGTYTA